MDFLSVLVFLSGCASGNEAREVARVTLTQINSYEKLVDEKINTEQNYYNKSIADLAESLKWGSKHEEEIRVTRAVTDFQSFVVNSKNDVQAKELRDFLSHLLEDLRHSRTLYAEAKTEYNQDLWNSLVKLEVQRESLDKVQKGLEKLQVKSVDPDLILAWFAAAQEIDKNLREKLKTSK